MPMLLLGLFVSALGESVRILRGRRASPTLSLLNSNFIEFAISDRMIHKISRYSEGSMSPQGPCPDEHGKGNCDLPEFRGDVVGSLDDPADLHHEG